MISKEYLSKTGRIKKTAPNSTRKQYYLEKIKLEDSVTINFPEELVTRHTVVSLSCEIHGFIKNITLNNAIAHGGCQCSKCRLLQ